MVAAFLSAGVPSAVDVRFAVNMGALSRPVRPEPASAYKGPGEAVPSIEPDVRSRDGAVGRPGRRMASHAGHNAQSV
jgi:hypothetical protein